MLHEGDRLAPSSIGKLDKKTICAALDVRGYRLPDLR